MYFFTLYRITKVMLRPKDSSDDWSHQRSHQWGYDLDKRCSWIASSEVLRRQSLDSPLPSIDCQSGVNGLLDVARQNFKEVTSDVFTLIDAYQGTRASITGWLQRNTIYQLLWSLRNYADTTCLPRRAISRNDNYRVCLRTLFHTGSICNTIPWSCVKKTPSCDTRWMRFTSWVLTLW